MDGPVDTTSCNLPEMLARDLAESESFFLAKSRTAGPPPVTLAFEALPPYVPQLNPSYMSTPEFHRTTSEADSGASSQDSAATADRCEQDKDSHKSLAAPLGTLRTLRRMNTSGVKNFHLKMENVKEERRVFLNSFDEEWGSDSSADVDTRLSSPSLRPRQQSVTTAATSVDVQFVAGAKGIESGQSSFEGPDRHHAPGFQSDGESWVRPETRAAEKADIDRCVPARSWEVGSSTRPCYPSPAQSSEVPNPELENESLISVPQRRSSLGHQFTTAIMGETVPSPYHTSFKPISGASSHAIQPSSTSEPQYFPVCHSHDDRNASEVASSPVIRTGRRQPPQEQLRSFQYHLNATPFDQLPPSPAPSSITDHCRQPSLNSIHLPQSPKDSVSRPRKSNSISRMPFLAQANTWCEAVHSSQRRYPAHIPVSYSSIAPITNIRVSTETLENLRIMVHSFPDTMLSTDCLTIQTIQSYSRKLKIGDVKHERVSSCGSDGTAIAKSSTSLDLPSQALDRKVSFGNLKLMTSLRGKISSRFASSPSSSTYRENNIEPWPPLDNNSDPIRCNSSHRASDKQEKPRYVTALRSIFPTGTEYLLDALYAHLIAYNYINSLCGGLHHLQHNGAGPHLQPRPPRNFVLPVGVTSLADLQLQEDAGELIAGDFYNGVTNVSSQVVVPSKAAAMLGLGSTNMGQPMKPAPGNLNGRYAKLRKTTPLDASFAASLESEPTLRYLSDNISHNIYRLVETVKSASGATLGKPASQEDEDGHIIGTYGKELEPTLMRAMCEVVRCYEELSS